MTLTLAILVLVIGTLLFGVGIAGQIALGQRRARASNPGDRASARIVLTLAAIIVGAWMVIASAAALLHSHSRPQHSAALGGPAQPSLLSTRPNNSTAAVVNTMS